MRLLHTADWHLGKTTCNVSRAEDHDTVLAEIIDAARRFRPHLILHAGDLFDGVRPSTAEMKRGITALQELAGLAPVVVLCGNHDSPTLFRIFNQLLGEKGRIRFVPQAVAPSQGGILEYPGDDGEIVRLAPLPFVHPNRMIDHFENPATWMAGYADQVGQIQTILGEGLRDGGYDPERHVLLFAAHLHVTGARFSNSERGIHVSETYATRVENLPPVSYAAYGHIHRPQPLPGTVTGRFAGSPLPLDFGEEGEEKSIVLVEALPGRAAEVTPHRLSGGRPLRRLEGTLEEIAAVAGGVGPALCVVTVRTEKPTPDLTERLTRLLPEAQLLSVAEQCAATRIKVLSRADLDTGKEPAFADLFREYLALEGTRGAPADKVLSLFESLLASAEEEIPFEPDDFKDLEAARQKEPTGEEVVT